jgi:hypothetical protein
MRKMFNPSLTLLVLSTKKTSSGWTRIKKLVEFDERKEKDKSP